MTKKDYIILASCLGNSLKRYSDANGMHNAVDSRQGIWDVVNRIANELALDNPRFNRQTFMNAILKAEQDGSGL